MDYEKFKEDMYNKMIKYDKQEHFYKYPSYTVNEYSEDPDVKLPYGTIEVKRAVSLICDILAEYDKEKKSDM